MIPYHPNSVAAEDTPYTHGFYVTPHDTAEIGVHFPRAIYVGTTLGGSTITCRLRDSSSDVTFSNVTQGTFLKISPTHIRATGTLASGLVAFI